MNMLLLYLFAGALYTLARIVDRWRFLDSGHRPTFWLAFVVSFCVLTIAWPMVLIGDAIVFIKGEEDA